MKKSGMDLMERSDWEMKLSKITPHRIGSGYQMGGAVSNPIPYNLGGSVYQQPMQYQLGGLLKYRSPM